MARRRSTAGTAARLKREGEYGYEPIKSKAQYEEVGIVSSRSDPNRKWKILRHKETGALKCTCPAYIFKGEKDEQGNKSCKHLKAYRNAPEELDAVYDPAVLAAVAAQQAAAAALEAQRLARIDATMGWLVAAAEMCPRTGGSGSLRAKLFERQWKELATALAPMIFANAPALSTEAVPVAPAKAAPAVGTMRPRQLRIIELDD